MYSGRNIWNVTHRICVFVKHFCDIHSVCFISQVMAICDRGNSSGRPGCSYRRKDHPGERTAPRLSWKKGEVWGVEAKVFWATSSYRWLDLQICRVSINRTEAIFIPLIYFGFLFKMRNETSISSMLQKMTNDLILQIQDEMKNKYSKSF